MSVEDEWMETRVGGERGGGGGERFVFNIILMTCVCVCVCAVAAQCVDAGDPGDDQRENQED